MELNQEFIDTMSNKGFTKAIIGQTKTATKLSTKQKTQLLDLGYATAAKLGIEFKSQKDLIMHLTRIVHIVHKG